MLELLQLPKLITQRAHRGRVDWTAVAEEGRRSENDDARRTHKIGFIRPKMVPKKSTGVPFGKEECGGNKLSSEVIE